MNENHHVARERVTCYTQITSDNNIVIPPEFVFKGAGVYAFLLINLYAKVKFVKKSIHVQISIQAIHFFGKTIKRADPNKTYRHIKQKRINVQGILFGTLEYLDPNVESNQ